MKRVILSAVALLVAMLASPAVVSADGSAASAPAPRYKHYVACGVTADAEPAHRCAKQGKKAAFFKSLDRDATYKVCVRFPNDKKLCANAQDAPEGDLRVNSITTKQIGEHTVTWFVGGKKVGTSTFRVFK